MAQRTEFLDGKPQRIPAKCVQTSATALVQERVPAGALRLWQNYGISGRSGRMAEIVGRPRCGINQECSPRRKSVPQCGRPGRFHSKNPLRRRVHRQSEEKYEQRGLSIVSTANAHRPSVLRLQTRCKPIALHRPIDVTGRIQFTHRRFLCGRTHEARVPRILRNFDTNAGQLERLWGGERQSLPKSQSCAGHLVWMKLLLTNNEIWINCIPAFQLGSRGEFAANKSQCSAA